MEVMGNVKSGWREFYSKTQLPHLAQGRGNYKIKKYDTKEGQDPEEGKKGT